MDLEFIPGKKYVNRKGAIYIYEGKFSLSVCPLLFRHVESDRPTWRIEGGKYMKGPSSHNEDIVAEYVEPEYRWFNLYKTVDKEIIMGGIHKSNSDAAIWKTSSNHVATVRINLKTGEVCRDM